VGWEVDPDWVYTMRCLGRIHAVDNVGLDPDQLLMFSNSFHNFTISF